jgi:hypothetical protein
MLNSPTEPKHATTQVVHIFTHIIVPFEGETTTLKIDGLYEPKGVIVFKSSEFHKWDIIDDFMSLKCGFLVRRIYLDPESIKPCPYKSVEPRS